MKDFTLYAEALALKELGFNEPCFGRIYADGGTEQLSYPYKNSDKGWDVNESCSAPTYAQAFRFFRNNYKLHSHINSDNSWNISGGIWDLNGYKDSRYDLDSDAYKSYPEAELTCLIKLIEIVKQNQKP